VREKNYINFVNNAVKRGMHNRPIKVVYTKNRPTTEGKQGVATHINMKKYDRIAIWKGLARNPQEKRKKERNFYKKTGRRVHVITRNNALRHELFHVLYPYASEKKVMSMERKTLPRKLPVRRR